MTAIGEQAFKAGLELVRQDGIPAKGNDIAVLAAYNVFSRHAAGKECDPRFEAEGPQYARRLIIMAFARGSE